MDQHFRWNSVLWVFGGDAHSRWTLVGVNNSLLKLELDIFIQTIKCCLHQKLNVFFWTFFYRLPYRDALTCFFFFYLFKNFLFFRDLKRKGGQTNEENKLKPNARVQWTKSINCRVKYIQIKFFRNLFLLFSVRFDFTINIHTFGLSQTGPSSQDSIENNLVIVVRCRSFVHMLRSQCGYWEFRSATHQHKDGRNIVEMYKIPRQTQSTRTKIVDENTTNTQDFIWIFVLHSVIVVNSIGECEVEEKNQHKIPEVKRERESEKLKTSWMWGRTSLFRVALLPSASSNTYTNTQHTKFDCVDSNIEMCLRIFPYSILFVFCTMLQHIILQAKDRCFFAVDDVCLLFTSSLQ